jgi:uncharacterized protein
MSEQVNRTDELEQALLALGDRSMVLEELDGFIAGILVCPDLIPPGEWFATALGLSRDHPSPFSDLDHANAVLSLVMAYYNDVVMTLTLRPEEYEPLFPVEDDGDVIWELWIDGFATAADLRHKAWAKLMDVGGETRHALMDLMILTEIATGQTELDKEVAERFGSHAQDLIRQAIVTLHQHRLATPRSPASFAAAKNPFAGVPKVGRNDPCPCGSGRKYKLCCGAN